MTFSLASVAGAALTTLVDLVLPRRCPGCGRTGASVCPACAATLSGPPFRAVPGRLATPGRRPLACIAAARYEGPARALVLAFKEHGRLDVTRPLGAALARAVAVAAASAVVPAAANETAARMPAGVGAAVPGGPCPPAVALPPILLVPVPSTAAARRRRGFDHVTRLSVVATRLLRREGRQAAVAPMLRPARRLADQSGLSAAERASNLHGAFVAWRPERWATGQRASAPPGTSILQGSSAPRAGSAPAKTSALRGGSAWPGTSAGRDRLPAALFLVVDDVVTTGATLAEAARALRSAGVPVAAAATVLATPIRDPTRRGVRLPASGVPEG